EVHGPLVADRLEEESLLNACTENAHCFLHLLSCVVDRWVAPTGSCRTAGRPWGRRECCIHRSSSPRSSFTRLLGETAEAEAAACGCRNGRLRVRGGGDSGCLARRHRSRGTEATLGSAADLLGLVDLDRGLLRLVTRLHVQVVRRLYAALPRPVVDVHHVAEVACLEVHVATDRLVDPLLRAGRHLEEGVGRELEAGLVGGLHVIRNGCDVLDVALT